MIKSKIKYQKSKTQTKIKNFGFCIVILIFGFWIFNFDCYAQPISSSELINNAKKYDGKTVSYAGEVIGDVMLRGDPGCPDCVYPKVGAWVNIYDGKNSIGVWMPQDFTKVIIYKGSYKSKGDWVELAGEFHRSCLEHGGDLDIHAISLKKLKDGSIIQEQFSIKKQRIAVLLLGISLCLIILQILRMKR